VGIFSQGDGREVTDMLVYEFYFRHNIKGNELIGILPERRRGTERVTQESIMNWAKIVFSDTLDINRVYFVPVTLEKNVFGYYFPKP
jgi:hypothetical protein